jgi:hypothetical protein
MALFDAQKFRFEEPNSARFLSRFLLMMFKFLVAATYLRVRRVLNFDPGGGIGVREIRSVLPLRHHAFQVVPTGEVKNLLAVFRAVIAVQNSRRRSRNNIAQDFFALDQGQIAQVASVKPEHIEGIVVRIATPVDQVVVLGPAVGIKAKDLTVEDRVLDFKVPADPSSKVTERFVRVTAAREQASVFRFHVGEATKSIVLDFENPVWMAKDVGAPEQRHRLKECR